ncbi:OLC1v1037953C4 [Oldenlandia corymbosa var. corymbosa]|uniref:OLC1v1037953C4 n=1 Tax=Oldenlandia corymbosa var. corymbosa TaxID=529605 RepID=A0AAV1CYL3_OLDCO|nr:OLC1v1037953C4 [Oldenlandia corymbosa var. corymbosa]
MDVNNGGVEIDQLEQGLLVSGFRPSDEPEYASSGNLDEEDLVLYAASFEEAEENFVKYQTAVWVLYSLLLILAWGIGIVMLLYLPIRRHILLKDFRSRKLYVTSNAIVYKVTKPVPFPCFGVLRKEKHIVLPSVADIVIEQGYLQSKFGVYSVRIENIGVRRPASDDVKIQGIANPLAFRKVFLF